MKTHRSEIAWAPRKGCPGQDCAYFDLKRVRFSICSVPSLNTLSFFTINPVPVEGVGLKTRGLSCAAQVKAT